MPTIKQRANKKLILVPCGFSLYNFLKINKGHTMHKTPTFVEFGTDTATHPTGRTYNHLLLWTALAIAPRLDPLKIDKSGTKYLSLSLSDLTVYIN